MKSKLHYRVFGVEKKKQEERKKKETRRRDFIMFAVQMEKGPENERKEIRIEKVFASFNYRVVNHVHCC